MPKLLCNCSAIGKPKLPIFGLYEYCRSNAFTFGMLMTRLRHFNPPRDLSNLVSYPTAPANLSKKEKKLRAQCRLDNLDTRPILTRAEKQARTYEADKLYLAENPPRLIKGTRKKKSPSSHKKSRSGS